MIINSDEAKKYLRHYFAQADKLNQTIAELNKLQEEDNHNEETLKQKVNEYEKQLDVLNAGKKQMTESLGQLGFEQPMAQLSQADLVRLAELLEP